MFFIMKEKEGRYLIKMTGWYERQEKLGDFPAFMKANDCRISHLLDNRSKTIKKSSLIISLWSYEEIINCQKK